MGWSLSQIRRKNTSQDDPTLNPVSLSLFSFFVAKRETLVGPVHQTTENLGGKKMGWQRGVAKSRNYFCNNLSQWGKGKKGDLPKCAALAK